MNMSPKYEACADGTNSIIHSSYSLVLKMIKFG